MASIRFNADDLRSVLPLVGLGTGSRPGVAATPQLSNVQPMNAQPPAPTPAAAGFGEWMADGRNRDKVARGVTLKGTPLTPGVSQAPSLFNESPRPSVTLAGVQRLASAPPVTNPDDETVATRVHGTQMSRAHGMTDKMSMLMDGTAGLPVPGITPYRPDPARSRPFVGSGSLPQFTAPQLTGAPPAPSGGAGQPTSPATLYGGQPDPTSLAGVQRLSRAEALQRQLTANEAEQQRLQSTGSGVSQIKNPWLRGIARIGDVAASVLTPGVAPLIPGTTARNRMLQEQAEDRAGAAAEGLSNIAKLDNVQAETAYTRARPAIEQSKLDQKQAANQQRIAQHAAGVGQTVSFDEDGHPTFEDDPNSSVYQKRQAATELSEAQVQSTRAQEELRNAQTDLERAKNDPKSPAFRQAQDRINVARQNASTAQGRLALAGKTYEMRAYGTANGVALPGSMIDDNGNTVGTAFQQNVRPTGVERNKGDMAASAAEQIGKMKQIIAARPDIFGPVAGRKTDFKVWLGSQDPDAQRFRAARTISGDHMAGTFGGRSEAALAAIDNAIGQFKDNPAAVSAGLDQLADANRKFLEAGTVVTTGSRAGNAAAAARAPRVPAAAYKLTASGGGGHKIGSNDGGATWFDVTTGRKVQ